MAPAKVSEMDGSVGNIDILCQLINVRQKETYGIDDLSSFVLESGAAPVGNQGCPAVPQ